MENGKEIIIDAKLESLYEVMDLVHNALEEKNVTEDVRQTVYFGLEEMLVNIANYAYPDGNGKVRVVVCFPEEYFIRLDLWDNGVPFDPTKKADPDVSIPLKQRKIGGLGIYVTKKIMDEMSYEHVDGANHTILIKDIRQVKSV